jgi:RHS repeat-associated protein
MYSFKPSGLPIKKRLHANENVAYYNANNLLLYNSTGTLNMDATYDYDNEGKMISVNYPTTYMNSVAVAGPTYTYSFDQMHRPISLTDQNGNAVVSGVNYGPANELKNITCFGVNESRIYNSMLQMTRLTAGQVDISYTFPSATTNNGKIGSQTDNISGETVTYQYDALNRLSVASGSGWNQNFGYDGFGNLVSKSGLNSPALSVAIDATTNRVVGQLYDYNGNQLTASTVSGYLGYDAENRLLAAPGVLYAYDVQNKRIWKGTFDTNQNLTGQELYFYGVDGQKLATYALGASYSLYHPTTVAIAPAGYLSSTSLSVSFGGKRVAVGGVAFVPDRLGSKGKYFPYGEERNSPPLANDQVKFAGYVRDSSTGLDYAEDDKSYYTAALGRFLTPLTVQTRGNSSDPGSWNLYRYEGSDPINEVSETPPDDPEPEPGPGGPPKTPRCPIGTKWDGKRCAPPEPECSITVSYRPVKILGVETGYYHLIVTTTVDDIQTVYEGEPQPQPAVPIGLCNPEVSTCPTNSLLVGVITQYGTQGRGTQWGDSIRGEKDICDKVRLIARVNSQYNDHELHYTDNGAPNSNSYAYTLLLYAGLTSDFGSPPVAAPGWGYDIIINGKSYY